MFCAIQSQSNVPHWTSEGSSFIAFVNQNIDMFSRFECTRNVKYCRGFVIDGDQAIKWREVTGSQEISVGGLNWLVSSSPPDLFHAP